MTTGFAAAIVWIEPCGCPCCVCEHSVESCNDARQRCAGSLEIRSFAVPGWDAAACAHDALRARSRGCNRECMRACVHARRPRWPSYSRVNHAKYVVSDGRLNVGTSNWEWGYFHNTAGASLNTDDTVLIAAAQRIFDLHWTSDYATPLEPLFRESVELSADLAHA